MAEKWIVRYASRWVNPIVTDKKRDDGGKIYQTHGGRLWTKRVIGASLAACTVVALFVLLKVIPNSLPLGGRATVFALVAGGTALYLIPLGIRNIQNRSLLADVSQSHDENTSGWMKIKDQLGFKTFDGTGHKTIWLPRISKQTKWLPTFSKPNYRFILG